MAQRHNSTIPFTKIAASLLLLLLSFGAQAQDLLWATKVVSYTSQAGDKRYAAKQALGKPNATPDSTANGWQPYGAGREESIVVSFDKTMNAKQILIVEGMNTGFVRKVCAISADGTEYEVAHFPAKPGTKHAKILQVNVADFNINIASVKVVLVPARHVTSTIDAIGITTSTHHYSLGKMQDVIAME